MCLKYIAQGHNTMSLLRIDRESSLSKVEHSATKLLYFKIKGNWLYMNLIVDSILYSLKKWL